ncbi:hypothetical protein [Streptomyces avermitilis]|uniref:hypothetical protein n=1 Tax=Streptomyces avermitilis TaxID=33903 RepID=UPI003814217B
MYQQVDLGVPAAVHRLRALEGEHELDRRRDVPKLSFVVDLGGGIAAGSRLTSG